MNENNPLVCVIDDESSIRESLSGLPRSAGLKVQAFSSAQEFLASATRDALGCLVLDVQLPGISGLDLQQKLASSDAQIPIIFITGHGDIPMSVRAIKAGALEIETLQGYDWPGNIRELRNVIERAVIFARGGALEFDVPGTGSPVDLTSFERLDVGQAEPEYLTESEMRRRERENLFVVLQRTGWKIKGVDGAAELLGL